MVYDYHLYQLFPVFSPSLHLGKEKSMSILQIVFCTPPFLFTSSLPHIKGGDAHHCELEMYVCDLCNRSFSTQGSLKRHRESVHRQSVGFSCQVCGQRFYRKNVLQRHLKTHRAACPTDKAFVRELKHEDFSRRRRRRWAVETGTRFTAHDCSGTADVELPAATWEKLFWRRSELVSDLAVFIISSYFSSGWCDFNRFSDYFWDMLKLSFCFIRPKMTTEPDATKSMVSTNKSIKL